MSEFSREVAKLSTKMEKTSLDNKVVDKHRPTMTVRSVSCTESHNNGETVDGDDELAPLPKEKLNMKLETAGQELVDCVCEPVSQDGSSIHYTCKYQLGAGGDAKIEGKFALKMP